jgi:hypothetical protein
MTELERSTLHAKEVLQHAVAVALDKKKRLGQYAIICKDGKPVRVEAEQLPSLAEPSAGTFRG